mgnify:CR=1 FL=1
MLQVKNLVKTYQTKSADVVYALNNVSIDFPEKGMVFLLGKSGSGKSTLLNAIGGLDKFDSGEIVIKGKSSRDFSQSDFDSYRNTFVGFIFQEYNILENFTVAKNLALALELQGKKAEKEDVDNLLRQVDMLSYANRKPNQLSGGQKQRVAIARALIKNPEIIMADEPTGALDSNTGKQVMDTLKELSKTKLVIIVSHDREFAEIYGDRIIELKDGVVIHDTTKKELIAEATDSDIKVIDNDIVYIKKGGKYSTDELTKIAMMIRDKTADHDMFLSFDPKANSKLKEGAKINDNGNKEAFVNTEPADIDQKTYNGNNLKLIKSHLKFSDSFKMGASSLKTKVGKLIFTILLSFIAFTIFGVVDTFSTWNRPESVYQSVTYSDQKFVVLGKNKDQDGWMEERYFKQSDIDKITSKFPEYTFYSLHGVESYISGYHNMGIEGKDLKNNSNPLWSFSSSAVLGVSQDLFSQLGFTLEGRLPSKGEEIAISKHLWDCAKRAVKDGSLTNWNGVQINRDGTVYTIVGVVDDKADLSKYEDLSDEQVANNYEIAYQISNMLSYSTSNFVYMTEAEAKRIDKANSRYNIYFTFEKSGSTYNLYPEINTLQDRFSAMYYIEDMNEEELKTAKQDFVNSEIVYFKGGKDKVLQDGEFVTLNKNEIIINEQVLYDIPNYETIIDNGTLKINVYNSYDIDNENLVGQWVVVGVAGYGNYVSQETNSSLSTEASVKNIFTILKGTNQDKELIKFCETPVNMISYNVQNQATSIFNSFGNLISTTASIFLYIGVGFAIFASLLLMNFISTSIAHKKREIGVLRALGARGSDIFGIFFNESTIIAFINAILAVIATFAVSMIINNVIVSQVGISLVLLTFSVRQIILLLVVSYLSAFLASLIPCVKISRKRPIDAINNR